MGLGMKRMVAVLTKTKYLQEIWSIVELRWHFCLDRTRDTIIFGGLG
jgi:hypothetical protein